MARSRNIKPGFFINDKLVELNFATRLLFVGLWALSDREGRLEDRPKKIKIGVFPGDDVDVDVMLESLACSGFIVRYEVASEKYIQIVNWAKHQAPHHTEKASVIPGNNGGLTVKAPFEPVPTPEVDGGNLADSLLLIPDSLIPEKKTRKMRGASQEITLAEYLVKCTAENQKALPDDHAIRAYCADAGITDEMLQVAWMVFKDRHLTADKTKTYRDWPGAFANCVKGCWHHLWRVMQNGVVEWTSTGLQERRVIETRMHEVRTEVAHAPE